jgi:hypothetical protein
MENAEVAQHYQESGPCNASPNVPFLAEQWDLWLAFIDSSCQNGEEILKLNLDSAIGIHI